MVFETVYNLGETVFVIHDNQVKPGTIKSIRVRNIHDPQILYELLLHDQPGLHEVPFSYVFKTMEPAIAFAVELYAQDIKSSANQAMKQYNDIIKQGGTRV